LAIRFFSERSGGSNNEHLFLVKFYNKLSYFPGNHNIFDITEEDENERATKKEKWQILPKTKAESGSRHPHLHIPVGSHHCDSDVFLMDLQLCLTVESFT